MPNRGGVLGFRTGCLGRVDGEGRPPGPPRSAQADSKPLLSVVEGLRLESLEGAPPPWNSSWCRPRVIQAAVCVWGDEGRPTPTTLSDAAKFSVGIHRGQGSAWSLLRARSSASRSSPDSTTSAGGGLERLCAVFGLGRWPERVWVYFCEAQLFALRQAGRSALLSAIPVPSLQHRDEFAVILWG